MTKSQLDALRDQVRVLAFQIGLRAAARAFHLNEERVKKWSQRGKWQICAVHPVGFKQPKLSPEVPTAIEVTQHVVKHYGNRAKIAATMAGSKALEHLADCEAPKLITPAAAIAGDQWTKAVDRAAGWTAERQRGATVNVAVINPPSQARVEEMKLADKQLDEFTKLLMAPDQEAP